MFVSDYIGRLHVAEEELAEAFESVAQMQSSSEIISGCKHLASWSKEIVSMLEPSIYRYGEKKTLAPRALRAMLFKGPHSGGIGLLSDLSDLSLLVNEVRGTVVSLGQAASALRDRDLMKVCQHISQVTDRQDAWLTTHIKTTAPQALVAS